eukprot:scaffold52535_cov65-Cyclotella_meneghiniana.AAC.2
MEGRVMGHLLPAPPMGNWFYPVTDDGVIISCAGHHISNILLQRSSMPGPGIAEAEAYGWIRAGSSRLPLIR